MTHSKPTDRVGDIATVEITRLAYGGDGIGRLESGRAVFVPRTAPGDVARVTLTQVAERFARAELAELETPSPDRVKPHCMYAGACGGCPWQHIAYPAQLRWKRQAVVDALVRTGHMDAEAVEALVAPCEGSKRQWNYRNKVEFEVTSVPVNGEDRLALGLHAAGSDDVVPVASCELLPKKLVKAPKSLTGALRFASQGDLTGLDIERVGIRVSVETGNREIALWTKPSAFPRQRVAKIVTDAVHASSVVRVLMKDKAKTRKVAGVETLSGSGMWFEQIGDERMHVTAPSFFQVNTAQAAKLVELVLAGLAPTEDDVVFDLYCGAGTFTLPLARRAAEVVAIESYGSSTKDLMRNLDDAGLYAEVICDDVARVLPELGDADLAVVDPPRAGLSNEACEAIMGLHVRKLAYVSCDPQTLARDLAKLAGKNGPYTIESVTPVDLFPQTYHVETVVILSR
jgi:23S rRNA (uracil1939-C5)-methyltransferase